MKAPTQLTDAGWTAAWEYGVRTVIDLRNPGEITPGRSRRPGGITTVAVPQDPIGTAFYDRWQTIDHLATPLYFPAMLTEHPEPVIAAVRAIVDAEPGCVVFHCAGGKDRTGLLALVLLALAGATATEIIADYLLTFERMEGQHVTMGAGDQLAKVRGLLARHGTTVEKSLDSTVALVRLPDFFVRNGLEPSDVDRLLHRLTD